MTGKVWLVGAGPSDVGLLTIKGKEVLQKADVVVYDALVGSGILALIPPEAEKINAGKRASNHLLRQEQTNEILLQKALEGKRVVRLKGGDPFLFGRGGEELELLSQHGVPYEVVPRRPGDIATCYADATKAKEELGWEAQYGIKEMCADSWRWQKNNPNGYEA